MSKFKILGVVNLLLSVLFIVIIIGSFTTFPSQMDLNALIHIYAPNLILLVSLIVNIYLSYIMLWKNNVSKNRFKQDIVLTVNTFFWFLWLFIGYFFVSEFIYPIFSLMFIIGMFIFIKRLSLKLAILSSLMTILVVILTIVFSFGQDYCWKKGDDMAIGKPNVITISAVEERDVFGSALGYTSSDSAQVGTAAYYNFKCAKDFDLIPALKEKYF